MQLNPIFHQDKNRLETERVLIIEAQKNPEKFGKLYKIYHESIFRYIYNRMDDIDTAHDVTSMVFMKALINIKKFEYRGLPFSSWLFRIAKSELNQSYREKKVKRTVSIDKIKLSEMMDEFVPNHCEKNRKQLLEALSRLSYEHVELIEMRFFEKRSYREIGQILNITENNAKVKTFRVLKKLRRHFNQIE